MSEDVATIGVVFVSAFAVSALLTRFAIAIFRRLGHVSPEDPWHPVPVALSAGIAIYLAVAPIAAFTIEWNVATIGLAIGCTAMMLVGLLDDLRPLRADLKLLFQFAVAIALIASGIYVRLIPWPALAIPITFLWIVGMTNAVNLIDNMDGLAPGVCAIASLFLGVLSLQHGDMTVAILAFALSGASGGFLLFNFPPARAFMGDAGSMFLGTALAGLTILSTRHHASSVLLALAAPVLILLVPLFNTMFVTVTRLLLGHSISTARPDHINYRLLAHGLSERTSIWAIYGMSALGGALAIGFAAVGTDVFIGLAVLGTIVLFVVAIFLMEGDLTEILARFRRDPDASIVQELRSYRSIVLFGLDVVVTVAAYYLAFLIRFDGDLPPIQLSNFAQTLPVFLVIRLGCSSAFGLYGVHWRYVGMADIVAIGQAVAVSSLLQVGLVFGLRVPSFARSVLVIDAILLLMMLVGVRLSTRLMRTYVQRFQRELPGQRRTLILGAGDAGELALRELTGKPHHGLTAVGFLDDDKGKRSLRIHGVAVQGTMEDLKEIVERLAVTDVLIAMPGAPATRVRELARAAQALDLQCSVFKFSAAVVPIDADSVDAIRVIEGGRTG